MIRITELKIDYIIALIFFLASFRYASPEAVSYSVPKFIEVIQRLALPGGILLLVYKVITNFNGLFIKNRLIFFYFIFYVFVYASDLYLKGLQIEPIAKIITVYIISLFFSNSLGWGSKSMSMEAVLLSLYAGIVIFVALNCTIYFLGIGSVMWKGRLFGLTSHPNFIGLISSISAFLSVFYLVNSGKMKLFLLLFVISFIVLLLSGSRNALLSFILFITSYVFFSTKNHFLKFILIFGGVGIVLFFFLNFSIQDLDFEGRGNNREGTWGQMWDIIMNLGLLGMGKSGATSNGFLFVITSAGFFGALFFYMSFFTLANNTFLQKSSPYQNLFKSSIVWILVSSLFEGYFLDTVGVQIFFLMFLLSFSNKTYDSDNTTTYPILQK